MIRIVMFVAVFACGCTGQQLELQEPVGVSDKPIGGGGKNPEVPVCVTRPN